MTTTMSDLPEDLVVAILSRVPMTFLGSVRSTCKRWNALSRNQIFGKVANNQFLGFMMKDFRICSVRMDLQRIHNDDDFTDLSIKHVSVLNQVEVYKVYHCDGLLLCTLVDTSRLLVWNPYLGQIRWIKHLFDSSDGFFLGYDNSGNHKILHLLDFYHEGNLKAIFGFKIYEFNSNSWRDIDVIPRKILNDPVTLKGNVYFHAQGVNIWDGTSEKTEHFLLCFDFTSERFGPHLSLPLFCDHPFDTVILSPVRDKQLAVLCQQCISSMKIEIWVTNKIDYNNVLWTKWMEVDMYLLTDHNFSFHMFDGSFFIDEENKVAVVFYLTHQAFNKNFYQRALIFGQDIKYIKSKQLRMVNSKIT